MQLPNASVYKNLELESKVSSASPYKLIDMLFDELQIQLSRIIEANQQAETIIRNNAAERSVNIINYLRASLSEEVDSELPHNLALLYDYMIRLLLRFRLRGEISHVEEVKTLVETIALAWKNIPNDSIP